jgi:ABC-2 type transport system ATP-binding protein
MSAVLTAIAVSKSFAAHPRVLDRVNLTAHPGDFLAVTGKPESGRTTLLRCLAGGYRPGSGTVELNAPNAGTVDLTTADARTLAWLRGQHLRSFDGPLAAPPSQDAAAAVARAARVKRSQATAALDRLGLARHADVPLGRLRQGTRRAVALAASLSASAPILLLDEPDTAADPGLVSDWLDELRENGTAVIAAVGPASPLIASASAVAYLHEGKAQWTRQ